MTPISTQGFHLESVSFICNQNAFGYFGSDIEQRKLRQVILIMHAHMCIFIETYYAAVASNVKQERKEERSPNIFSFVEGEGCHRTTKRAKDKTILG